MTAEYLLEALRRIVGDNHVLTAGDLSAWEESFSFSADVLPLCGVSAGLSDRKDRFACHLLNFVFGPNFGVLRRGKQNPGCPHALG